MSQDPNVWWAKEIGRDFNKGMMQGLVDSRQAWKGKSPKERRQAIWMTASILTLEGAIAYLLYRLVIRFAHSR